MSCNSNKKFQSKIFISFLLLFFSSSFFQIAFAQSCAVNCLRVYSIALTDHNTFISATVKLSDETGSGAGARGAVVHAVWTRPDGTTFDQYANIGTRLRASFRLYHSGVSGTYTLTVADATKNGYMFDQRNSNLLSKEISIGNVSNQSPKAVLNTDVISGSAPLTVNFDSSDSFDTDGMITKYNWNFGDGSSSTEVNPTHTYNNVGHYNASLTITDDQGANSSTSTAITVSSDNTGCDINCMTVDRIYIKNWPRYNRIRALVWIVDENNSSLRRVLVHARWTLPNGSTIDQYRNIGTRGRAAFILPANTPGSYKLSIIEVTKAGYTFDPDNSNVLEGVINIAK